jgi:hypothetical protein
VEDLVGRNIKGIRANVTNPAYRDQYKDHPERMIKTLIKAEWKREKHKRWLYIRWIPDTANHPHDCGFSGWLDGHNFRDEKATIELLDGELDRLVLEREVSA